MAGARANASSARQRSLDRPGRECDEGHLVQVSVRVAAVEVAGRYCQLFRAGFFPANRLCEVESDAHFEQVVCGGYERAVPKLLLDRQHGHSRQCQVGCVRVSKPMRVNASFQAGRIRSTIPVVT